MLTNQSNARSGKRSSRIPVDSYLFKLALSGFLIGYCISMNGQVAAPPVATKRVLPQAQKSPLRPVGGEIEKIDKTAVSGGYVFKSLVFMVDPKLPEKFDQRLSRNSAEQPKQFFHVFRIYDNNNKLIKEVWNDMLPLSDFKRRILDEDLWEKELLGGVRFLAFDSSREIVYGIFTSDDSRTASFEVFGIPLYNNSVKHVGTFGSMGGYVNSPSLSPDGDVLAIVTIPNSNFGESLTLLHLGNQKVEELPRPVDYDGSDTSQFPLKIKSITWGKDRSISYQLGDKVRVLTYKYE